MPRITKSPDERRNELIDAAEMLFIENGYDQTSVSDIVKKVNVAQGTFYYYFNPRKTESNTAGFLAATPKCDEHAFGAYGF